MENRKLAIAVTIASVLFCGIPGLMWLGLAAAFSLAPPIFESPRTSILISVSLLSLGVTFLAVSIVIGFFTWRKRVSIAPAISEGEPIPPPS